MSRFSLSYSKGKTFPERAKDSQGNLFFVDANFRTILKILRLMNDSEVFEQQKILLLLKWFYKDVRPESIEEALNLFVIFLNGNKQAGKKEKKTESESRKQFDYEFDAEEIYTSFIKEYQIDLYEIDFLHWYKFQMLLLNLSQESPFSQKIKLRFLNLRDYKGENYLKLSRAKRSVQLPVQYSREEAEMLKELEEKLKS